MNQKLVDDEVLMLVLVSALKDHVEVLRPEQRRILMEYVQRMEAEEAVFRYAAWVNDLRPKLLTEENRRRIFRKQLDLLPADLFDRVSTGYERKETATE